MSIRINDRECEAKTGDRLLDAARANHSHIGYFCGGNAICQTCYVKVLEGQDLLSPLSDAEKSMLSDKLIGEGIRMACQTTIEKPGTVRILTEVEAVKRMVESNPLEAPAYMGKMGWESAVKFTDTIAFQARREQGEYKLGLWQLLTDVVAGIGEAIQLVVEAVQSVFAPRPETPAVKVPAAKLESCCGANTMTTHSCGCGSNEKTASPELVRLHQQSTVTCN
ncbi:MAG: (2Fe-2S)-binding protein [Chlorobiaceae bacterium]|nr:(2Fe-2S)-binding protein [Chlorobiaceae bacterium]